MRELTINELQEYIHNAIMLETDIATQERIVEIYDSNAAARKPVLVQKNYPAQPQYTIASSGGNAVAIIIALDFFLFFFGLAPICVGYYAWVGLLLWLIGILITIPLFIPDKASKEASERYTRDMGHYYNEVEKITKQNTAYQERHTNELRIWDESNRAIHSVMTKALNESKDTLEELYSLEYIYPKYRSLPALTSIYEYLITGRCEGLTGPHGAYNLYEDEVRKDMVISQLSIVIQNLEQIKQNQYMLYQQVKTIQQNTCSIENELKQIKGHTVQIASLTALNAYYAAQTERNTRITMWCHI